jgi:phosphoribosylformimino-5-aminoimidazole carboxamide ribotide isomerase
MSSRVRRSCFRPCIDLHEGRVKQIVGGTLSDDSPSDLKINFISRRVDGVSIVCDTSNADETPRCSRSAGYFARLYKDNGLEGGHVIKLGLGNDDAAREALGAWPGGQAGCDAYAVA